MNSATSRLMAAPPLNAYLRRPPKRSRTFEKTSRSKTLCLKSTKPLLRCCSASFFFCVAVSSAV